MLFDVKNRNLVLTYRKCETKIKSQSMKRFTKDRRSKTRRETKKNKDGRKFDGRKTENDGRSRTDSQKPGKADHETLGILSSAVARYHFNNHFQICPDLRRTDRVSGL